MGVHGLWQLLQSTGHPIALESLAGKVLGIDVSMWLHQAGKGMRDRHGNTIPNAHLIFLFRRLCKLLYYRIKPVFVFDGGVPLLKKQTLAQRRRHRDDAIVDADQTAKKLVSRLLQKEALNLAINPSTKDTKAAKISSSSRTSTSELDIFYLSPLPEHASSTVSEADEGNTWERRMEQRDVILSHFEDIEKINTESEDFASLPAEIKHEILTDLKDIRRSTFWSKSDEMPADSDEFSKYQLNRLMKQSRLTQHLNKVRKELTAKSSGEIAMDVVGSDVTGFSVEASRVFSEDSSHYFLIKGLRQLHNAASEANSTESFDKAEDQCSELNNLVTGNDYYGDINIGLKRSERDRIDTLHETMESASSFSNEKTVVPTDSGSVDLGSEETDSYDEDDRREKTTAMKQKRKLHIDMNADEKKLKIDTSKETKIESSGEVDRKTENVSTVEVAQNETSPTGTFEKDEDANNCLVALVSDLSPNISADLKNSELSPAYLPGPLQEEIPAVVDDKSESESSDDEGFIEVEPESVYDLQELCPVEPSVEAKFSKLVEKEAEAFLLRSGNDDYEASVDATEEASTAFKGACQGDLLKMQQSLEDEMLNLRKERGKQERLAMSITDQMQVEAQELLNLFGVPFVISPTEAEAQCAFLDLTNQTQGTVTDDSDIWLFGGRHVYRNVFNQNRHVELYTFVDINSRLLLEREDFIKLALLCGSDYTEGLQGVGPVTALEILAEFPGAGIESLIKFRDWFNEAQKQSKVPPETKVKSKLRNLKLTEGFPNAAVFDAYLSPALDDSQEPFSWTKPDFDLLRQYGGTKLGLNQSQVDELLKPLMKSFSEPETSQSSVTDFFLPETREMKRLKSSRVRNVINRMRSQNNIEPYSERNNITRSSKGKATKGLKTKNRKSQSTNCGGFVSSSIRVPTEVKLSEESSDDEKAATVDDEFEVSDEVLAAIDLDVPLINEQSTSTTKSVAKSKSTKTRTTKKTRTKVL